MKPNLRGGAGEEDHLKKCAIIICILLLAAFLGACGGSAADKKLPETIRTQDRRISIRVPEGWTEYETELGGHLVLVAKDSTDTAFVQIFRYEDVGKAAVKDYLSEAADFYGSAVAGSSDDVTINGQTGYYFAYKSPQADASGNTYTCQGYEYFVPVGDDIVEVDIFYRYTEDTPNLDELAILKSIAESLKAK